MAGSLQLRGKVDRIDQLRDRGALGVVDYKSSLTQFHYDKFFNGLNSQLPTYLSAIQDLKEYQEEQRDFRGHVFWKERSQWI